VLAAANPAHAIAFFAHHKLVGFLTLGVVVLAVTGCEALYADLGHFGRRAMSLAWIFVALPGLLLNYFGQGALMLRSPAATENPFYLLVPSWGLYPMIVLATLATVIASQAVISGAYSLTRQAIQLGFLPRMTVRHTSAHEAGQIYLPAVNWALLAGVAGAVLYFGSSSALAGAYGIAVTMTMLITTVLTYFVVRRAWRLPAPLAIGATAFFLAIDALLVAGCAVKFFDGGWMPLALGALLFLLMSTWRRGRALALASVQRDGVALEAFVRQLDGTALPRAGRTAVYPAADPQVVPQALLHNLKHNQVLHESNVILHLRFEERPWVGAGERVAIEDLGHGFWRVTLHFGFMDEPDVPAALKLCAARGLPVPPFETSYFLSRETVVPTPGAGMMTWRERVFAAMSRNAKSAAEYFRLPDNTVVELGTRVQI